MQCRQAQITLVLDLEKVVNKADGAKYQCKGQHQQVRIIPLLVADACKNTHQHRRDKDDPTDGRRAVFAAVPLRPDLPDRLARFQGVQHGDIDLPQNKPYDKRAENRYNDPYHALSSTSANPMYSF